VHPYQCPLGSHNWILIEGCCTEGNLAWRIRKLTFIVAQRSPIKTCLSFVTVQATQATIFSTRFQPRGPSEREQNDRYSVNPSSWVQSTPLYCRSQLSFSWFTELQFEFSHSLLQVCTQWSKYVDQTMLFPGAGVLQPSPIDQGRQVRQTWCLNRDEEHLPFQVQNGEFPSSTCPYTSHEGRVTKYGCFEKVHCCTCKNPDIWIENVLSQVGLEVCHIDKAWSSFITTWQRRRARSLGFSDLNHCRLRRRAVQYDHGK